MAISDDDYRLWEENGYVLIEDLLDKSELEAVLADIAAYFPNVEEYFSTPLRYQSLTPAHWFPYVGNAVNDASMHPDLVAFAERALGTNGLLMTHALVAKYSGADHDQILHSDLANNTLVYPREEGEFRHLTAILYLSEVTEDDGPTFLVPRQHAEHIRLQGGWFTSEEYPEPYEHEVPVTCRAGSALIYGMEVLHRGSAVRGGRAGRFTLMPGFRRSGFEWMGHHHKFAQVGPLPHFAAWLERATPRQRQLVGFPAPGHRYWNDATIAGTAERYPRMDMDPYRCALDALSSSSTGAVTR